jgi:hypothetical protein
VDRQVLIRAPGGGAPADGILAEGPSPTTVVVEGLSHREIAGGAGVAAKSKPPAAAACATPRMYSALRSENCISRSAVTGAAARTIGSGKAWTVTPPIAAGTP